MKEDKVDEGMKGVNVPRNGRSRVLNNDEIVHSVYYAYNGCTAFTK